MRAFLTVLLCAVSFSAMWAQADTVPLQTPIFDLALSLKSGDKQKTYLALGLTSRARHLRGAQIVALGNGTDGDMKGVQLAGIANVVRESAKGLQAAALFNYAGSTQGVQLSAVANISKRSAKGLQAAGITNIAVDGSRTIQLAVNNIVLGHLRGVQMGVANYAGSMRGVQVGLINIAGGADFGGVQVGLINATQDTTALKIGLVNLTPATRTQLLLFGGNTTKGNMAVRFLNGNVYTMIGFGVYYRGLDDEFSGDIAYRVGYRKPLSRQWALSADLGVAHIEDAQRNEQYRTRQMYAFQGRINAEYQATRRLAVFASAGYHVANHYAHNAKFENKPIMELGIMLF